MTAHLKFTMAATKQEAVHKFIFCSTSILMGRTPCEKETIYVVNFEANFRTQGIMQLVLSSSIYKRNRPARVSIAKRTSSLKFVRYFCTCKL